MAPTRLRAFPRGGFEQLIRRVITNSGTANGTIHTVHDQWGNVIAELNATGATVREYIYLPEAEIAPTRDSRTTVDRPVAVVDGVNTTPVTLYVHADHLHRPVRMTNAAKATVWDVIWTPWGAPHTITGAQTLNARFPGQWFQLEAGLHYNWHRHYDPSLGRYTQPDPLGFVDGPSVYAYARSAPVRLTDKNGKTTYVIVNTNGLTGHTGLVVIGPSGNALYDPGGSYRSEDIGTGQALLDEQVDLNDYVNYQKQDGPNVEVLSFPTTPEEEKLIIEKILNQGGCLPFYCTQCTASVLDNTSPFFKDLPYLWWPGNLARELKRRR